MKENLYDPTSMRRVSAFETQIPLPSKPEGPLRSSNLRFIVLVLISIVGFGTSFSTSPSMIATAYENTFAGLVFYAPYIFIPLLGGVIVDKWSARGSLVLFGLFVAVGNILLSALNSSSQDNLAQFGIGTFLIVFGSGCLVVAQATIAAKWFRNKELALAIGAYLCMNKIASLLGYVILIDNYQDSDESDYNSGYDPNYDPDFNPENIQQIILNYGIGLSMFSLAGIIALFVLDLKADEQDAAIGQIQGVQENSEPGPIGLKNYPLVYHLLIGSMFVQGALLSLDRSLFTELVRGDTSWGAIGDIAWYSIIGIVFALFYPLFGLLVDKFGKKTLYLLISSIVFTIMCIVFICVMILNKDEYEMLKFGYLFFDAIFQPVILCVFWFCIPIVFDQRIMGMGTGIAICTLNALVFINGALPILIEAIFEGEIEYDRVEFIIFFSFVIYFTILALLGTVFSSLLYREDTKTGRKLASPSIIQMEKQRGLNPGIGINNAYL